MLVCEWAKGQVISVRQAQREDFEVVFPLLDRYFAQVHLSRQKWRTLFECPWSKPNDFPGFLLVEGKIIRGFLGTIFSERQFEGGIHRLCNMTSWVVEEGYRAHSLKLLLAILTLPDCTITNFTPSPAVATVLGRSGFIEISDHRLLLWPLSWPTKKQGVKLVADHDLISQTLSIEDQRILRDHQQFRCDHLLLSDGERYCYLVTSRLKYRGIPVARIHYVSNPVIFERWNEPLRFSLCLRLGVAGLMIEKRAAGNSPKNSRIAPDARTFYKSSVLRPTHIDTLYSEMIILHA